MENEEELSPRPEEEVTEEMQEVQTDVEEDTTPVSEPEPEPAPAPEPKKSSKASTDKKFEQWWQDFGEKLVQDGFSKRSIIVRVAKEFSKDDTVLYTDVAQKVGSEVIQNPSIKEACREVSKKIS